MAIAIRRIVSGVFHDGSSGVIQDGPAAHVVAIDKDRGVFRTDIWSTSSMPYDNKDQSDPTTRWPNDRFSPLPNGTTCFVMEIPPDDPEQPVSLHQTDTLDYVVILCGEVHVVYSNEERLVRAGDILVQRGIPHAWSNRSGQPCTFLAVMIDAKRKDLEKDV